MPVRKSPGVKPKSPSGKGKGTAVQRRTQHLKKGLVTSMATYDAAWPKGVSKKTNSKARAAVLKGRPSNFKDLGKTLGELQRKKGSKSGKMNIYRKD